MKAGPKPKPKFEILNPKFEKMNSVIIGIIIKYLGIPLRFKIENSNLKSISISKFYFLISSFFRISDF